MKTLRYIILLISMMTFVTGLFATRTPSATAFSNSYMMRSSGVEAAFWNPANISRLSTNHELMVLPITLSIENNAIDINLYNKISGAVLTPEREREILSKMDYSLLFRLESNVLAFGYVYKNWAITSSVQAHAKGEVDKQYMDILFHGNKTGEAYHFNQKDNNFGLIVYNDLNISYGGYNLNNLEFIRELAEIPDIYVGAGFSYLTGIVNYEMRSFDGRFLADKDGISLEQDFTIRSAMMMGQGFKFSFGMSSDVYKFDDDHYFSAGISMDNIFGQIKWSNDTELLNFKGYVEGTKRNNEGNFVFMDILGDDLWQDEQETTPISAYTTRLPFAFRLGTLYTFRDLTASFDLGLHQDTGNHAFISDPDVAFGFEYLAFHKMPLQIGVRLPGNEKPTLFSYGTGLRLRRFEMGFGIQDIGGFTFGQSKGFAYSGFMKFRW